MRGDESVLAHCPDAALLASVILAPPFCLLPLTRHEAQQEAAQDVIQVVAVVLGVVWVGNRLGVCLGWWDLNHRQMEAPALLPLPC